MPLAHLYLPSHLPPQRGPALADAVHRALVATCGVPEGDCFQLIHRMAAADLRIDPHFPDLQRSADASIVAITFLHGRSDAQKRQLYQDVQRRALAAGFAPDDVLIALTENQPIDWSLGRGLAFDGHPADDGISPRAA